MRHLLAAFTLCLVTTVASTAYADSDDTHCTTEDGIETCCQTPTHCIVTAYFQDSDDAQAACIASAAVHHYEPFFCTVHANQVTLDQPRWAAGWLMNDKLTSDKSVFWFYQYYYEVPCLSSGDGFWIDWDTGNCTCTDDSACDDGLVCNGQETCDPINGGCAPGPPLDCSDPDALVCTAASCQEPFGCVNEPVDEALCVCEETEVEPVVTTLPQVGLSELAVSCPIIGGSASAKATVSGEYSMSPPSCANGCQGSTATEATLNVAVSLCGGGSSNTKSVGLKGTYSRETQSCTTCDDASCELICDASGCVEEGMSGGVDLGVSQGVGVTLGPKRLFGAQWHAYITGQLSGSASLSGSRSETSGELECAECQACSTSSSELALGGSVVAAARVSGSLFGKKINLALENLAHLSVDATASSSSDCDGVACVQNQVHVSSGVKVPIPAGNVARFWGLRDGKTLHCHFTAKACAESNGCGSCSSCDGCADSQVEASCGLTGGQGGGP